MCTILGSLDSISKGIVCLSEWFTPLFSILHLSMSLWFIFQVLGLLTRHCSSFGCILAHHGGILISHARGVKKNDDLIARAHHGPWWVDKCERPYFPSIMWLRSLSLCIWRRFLTKEDFVYLDFSSFFMEQKKIWRKELLFRWLKIERSLKSLYTC